MSLLWTTSADTLLGILPEEGPIAFDTECVSLSDRRMVGFSLAWPSADGISSIYIPIWNSSGVVMPWSDAQSCLIRLTEKYDLITFNGKFDYSVVKPHVRRFSIVFDVMMAAHFLHPARYGRGTLKEYALEELGIEMQHIQPLLEKYGSLYYAPVEVVAPYAAEGDARCTFLLYQKWFPLCSGFAEILHAESVIQPMVRDMEVNGVLLDKSVMSEVSDAIRKVDKDNRGELEGYMPGVFLNSPESLSQHLFGEGPGCLGIDFSGLPRGKKGFISTADPVLATIEDRHEIIAKIRNFRSFKALVEKYLAYGSQTDADGRVHPGFNQWGTANGRFSGGTEDGLNFQNIPKHGPGIIIRRAFIVPPGYSWYSADLSQIELRCLFGMSGVQKLMQYFWDGVDMHSLVASICLHKKLSSVTKAEREMAKPVNYGAVYGQGVYALLKFFDGNRIAAARAYERIFPGLEEYMDTLRNQAHTGYATSYFGRRMFLGNVISPEMQPSQVAFLKRLAVNYSVAATAADIFKLAMARLSVTLPSSGIDHQMLLQIHDDIDAYVITSQTLPFHHQIVDAFNSITFPVPIVAEAAIGPNWFDIKPYHPEVL